MNGQGNFAQALLDPQQPCPSELRCWNGSDPTRRFAVYRNNVVVSLVDALAEQFPVTLALVGDEFFQAMARQYVQQHPPRSRLIVYCGETFADFVESFAPAVDLPYLADVVRLEFARVRACHAQDLPVLTSSAVTDALSDPQTMGERTLVWHPSVQLLQSRHAVCSLWAAHQGLIDIGDVDPDVAQDVLVFRNEQDVETLQLPPATAPFLSFLQRGLALGDAATRAAQELLPPDLPAALALLLRHPLVTRIES